MHILFSILTLCPWVLVAGLIVFVVQIARFYQKKYAELYASSPRQRTYYPVFWVPLFLFVIAAGRYAFLDDLAGDVVGDVAFFVGGAVLAAVSYRLQQLMTGGRQ